MKPLRGPMDAHFRLDRNWQFTLLNDACEIYLGSSRDQLLGRTLWEAVPGLLGTQCEAEYRAAMAQQAPCDFVGPAAAYPGRWVEARITPEDEGLDVHLRDVTERVQIEEQLRQSEERLRLAQEAGGLGLWDWDLRTGEVYWSKSYCKLWQIDPSTTPSFEAFLARVDPRDRSEVSEGIRKASDVHEPWSMRMRVACSKPIRWVAARGEFRRDSTGQVVRMIGVCWDETESVTSEQRLRQSETRYRRLFEQANDLIYTCDLHQNITDCNRATAHALGTTIHSVVGRPLSDFLSEQGQEQASEMIRRKLEMGGTTFHEIPVRRVDGTWRTWEINSGLVLDEEAKPVGVHAVARDITDRKAAENQQKLLLDELNHRVKNTLAIVQSLAQQTLRNGGASPELQDRFESRLAALAVAHDLLTRENWVSASFRTIAQEAVAPFCDPERCRLSGPDLRVSPKAAVTFALALHELATNASKYGALSSPAGQVHVTWRVSEERFLLEWRESGGPTVKEPLRRGFGSRLLERALSRELAGKTALQFNAEGLIFEVEAAFQALS